MEQSQSSKKPMLTFIVIVVLFALIIGGIWALFNSGRLVYVAPGSKVATSQVVCGNDIVDRYNAAMFYIKRDNDAEPSIDEKGVSALASDIRAKENYKDDATCQTILFWTAVYNKNLDEARVAADAVKQLHKKNIFANSNIRSNQPIFVYDTYLVEAQG